MSLSNVCRLCLLENNLVWVFDRRFENTNIMKNVIFITTGVDISITDVVSQNICEICCRTSLNMFEFRKKSLQSDKHLKEQLKLESQSSMSSLPNEVQIKKEPDIPSETREDTSKFNNIHPSVKELYKLHPHIRLPNICLTSDIAPFVTLPMDEVEHYFRQHNLNFLEHSKLALKPRSTARKRTLPSPKAKYSSPVSIRGEIITKEVEDFETGALLPIKIKIISNIPISNKQPLPMDVQEPDNDLCHKKMRYTDTKESPSIESEIPEDTEHQHSTILAEHSTSVSYVTKLSQPLCMCDICDEVHNNHEDLEAHRHTHLRCQFCGFIFHSFEDRSQHLQSKCPVKEASNNFLCPEVVRVESNCDIVNKYPEAFANFPVSQVDQNECHEIHSDSKTDSSDSKPSETVDNDDIEVIEILSDDEDVPTNSSNIPQESATTKMPKLTKVIKPNVSIKDSAVVIPSNSNDQLALKDLLTSLEALITYEEKGVQTKTSRSSIEMNDIEQTAVLTNMKDQLRMFQIPVVIRKGSFNVSYKQIKETKSKNLELWHDLSIVDIKKSNAKIPTGKQVDKNIILVSASNRTCVAEDERDDCILVTEDSTVNDSKTPCDENCNSISISESTTNTSVTSTYSQITTTLASSGISATSSSSSTRTTAQPTSPASATVSPSHKSISNPENRSTAVVHRRRSFTPNARPVPQNTPRSDSSLDHCTYSTSDHKTATSKDASIDRSLVNHPMTSHTVPPSYSTPQTTLVNNIPSALRPGPAVFTSASDLSTYSVAMSRVQTPAIYTNATSKDASIGRSLVNPQKTLPSVSSSTIQPNNSANVGHGTSWSVPTAPTSPLNLCASSSSEIPKIMAPTFHTTATSKVTSIDRSFVNHQKALPTVSSHSFTMQPNTSATIAHGTLWPVPDTLTPPTSAIIAHGTTWQVPTPLTSVLKVCTSSSSEVPKILPPTINATATSKDTSMDRSLVNSQMASPTVARTPNRSVNNIPGTIRPAACKLFRKPKSLKKLQLFKDTPKLMQNSGSASGNNGNDYNFIGQTSSFNNDVQRPATPFITYDYRTTSNTTSSYVNQQPTNTSVNKSFTEENASLPSTLISGASLNFSETKNTTSLLSGLSNEHSYVSAVAAPRNQAVGVEHAYAHNSGVFPYSTTMDTHSYPPLPYPSNGGSSLPFQIPKPVQPQHYFVDAASKQNNAKSPLTNVTNAIQKYYEDTRYSSVSSLNSTSLIPLPTTSQVNPRCCSTASPTTGHIRVKNIQELT